MKNRNMHMTQNKILTLGKMIQKKKSLIIKIAQKNTMMIQKRIHKK